MKRHNKYLIMVFISVLALFQACETFELERLDDPNNLGPDQADATLLFNQTQLNYLDAVTTFNNIGGELSRIENMFGRVYLNNYSGSALNDPWGDLYSGMLPDISTMESQNTDGSLNFVVGASKAMQAHLMMLLVDYIGDITNSEANNPSEYPNPKLDDDEQVYTVALNLLDEASALIQGSSPGTALDMFYGGDTDKWVKFINTLKMRAALTTGDYQAVIDATNVIETEADNMVFEYGTNELSPDTRHPDYQDDYGTAGATNYRSNWLMNLMVGTFGDLFAGPGDNDPRRRYYFYRQTEAVPGSYNVYYFDCGGCADEGYYFYQPGEDSETLICSTQETPNHLQFTPQEDYWCSVRMGYWGRDHGNAEGIPPDNFTRTASGVYPAGGRFDDNLEPFIVTADGGAEWWTAKVGLGLGAQGQGIEPIILSSFVEFWRAEAYMALNPGMAAQHLNAGISESINYVMSFGPRDSSADLSFAPDAVTVDGFIAERTAEFENADTTTALDAQNWPVEKDKMDILGEQFFIAMYGAGADAFNFIRRTGYPRTLSRSIDANPGPFPRTLLRPSNETGANPNVNQRLDNSDQVFWDSGIINPAN